MNEPKQLSTLLIELVEEMAKHHQCDSTGCPLCDPQSLKNPS